MVILTGKLEGCGLEFLPVVSHEVDEVLEGKGLLVSETGVVEHALDHLIELLFLHAGTHNLHHRPEKLKLKLKMDNRNWVMNIGRDFASEI